VKERDREATFLFEKGGGEREREKEREREREKEKQQHGYVRVVCKKESVFVRVVI